jgi:hypothetical protein
MMNRQAKVQMFSLFWVTAPLTDIVVVRDSLTEIVIEV